LTNKIIK